MAIWMPRRVHVGKFCGDFVDAFGIDAKALIGRQGFAGEFQKNAFEDGSWHENLSVALPRRSQLPRRGCFQDIGQARVESFGQDKLPVKAENRRTDVV